MKEHDVLQTLLDAADAGPRSTADSIDRLTDVPGLDDVTGDEFAHAVARHAEWDGEVAPEGEFELRGPLLR